MMREVRLYGHLGRKFGRVHHFDVSSPAEAVAALRVNFPDFERYLLNNSLPGYHVFVGQTNVGKADLTIRNETVEPIRIAPVIAGSKRAGAFQVVVGAVLVVVGYIMTFTPAAALSPYVITSGIAMMVGGVAQMLIPQQGPKERPENQPSFFFDGPVNTTAQGQPVPVLFGRLLVGSAVISSGISTEEIAATSAADPGPQTMPADQPIYEWGNYGTYSDA